MNNLWMIILANFKKKKMETLLMGASIAVSALALCVAAGLLSGLNKPYETGVSELNASHLLLMFDTRVHHWPEVRDWLESQPETLEVTPKIPVYQTTRKVVCNGQELDPGLMLAERNSSTQMDQVRIVTTLNPDQENPGPNEIWLPKRMADAESISLGDQIQIPTKDGMVEWTVSALVVDPHFSINNVSPIRCYVAAGALGHHLSLENLTDAYLGARLEDPMAAEALQERFLDWCGGRFAGFALSYNLFKMGHGIFMKMLGVGLLIIAILAVLISIFIIQASITSSIYADYRFIGIYKTLGMTPSQVNRLYVFQYLILVAVFAPLGALGGIMATQAVFGSVIKAVGMVNVQYPLFLPAIAAALMVTGVVWLSAWWTSRRAGQVNPMEAIRFGAPPPAARRRFSALAAPGVLPIPLFLGFRNLFLNMKRTLFSTVGLVFTVVVLVFSVNIVHTFENFGDHMGLLGGVESDVTVRLTGKRFTIKPEQFQELMEAERDVRTVMAYGSITGTAPAGENRASRQIVGQVYDGNLDGAGLQNLEGRNPAAPDEISIGVNTAKIEGKTIGDPYEIYIEGELATFTITGIYQTGMNFGDGFRLTAEPVKERIHNWKPRAFALHLVEGVTSETMKERLKLRFAEAVTVRTILEDSDQIAKQISGLKVALLLVSMILLAVSFVAIFNDTMLSMKEQTRTLGVLKATGLTPFQLRASLACKAMAVACLGLLVGLPLAMIGIPLGLSALAGGIGLVQFPFSMNMGATLLVIPGLAAFAFICAWIPARAVTSLNVRNLISQ